MATENKPLEKTSQRLEAKNKKSKKQKVENSPARPRDVALSDWLRITDLSPEHIRERLLNQLTSKKLSQASLLRLQQFGWGLSPLRFHRLEKMLAALQLLVESDGLVRPPPLDEPVDTSWLDWIFQKETTQTLHAETLLGVAALATCWPWLQHLDTDWVEFIRQGWADTLELAQRLPAEDVDMISWLIAHVELPLIFSTWADHPHLAKTWSATATQSCHETVTAAKDDASAWIQSGGRRLRASMASCMRSIGWWEQLRTSSPDSDFKKGFAKLLVEALRWTRKDGSLLLSPQRGSAGELFDDFWTTGYRIAGRPKSLGALFASRLPKRTAQQFTSTTETISKKLFPPTTYWTNGEAGIMQREWDSHGSRIAVDYSVDPLLVEVIGMKGESLLAGPWSCEVWCDDKQLPITSSWQEVCWFSEDDVDYLELEASCDEHCKIQRQILFIRQSGIVLLADALLGSQKANWRIQSTLPVAGDYQMEVSEKTRECWLSAEGKRQALLVPLASNEWQRQFSPHQLSLEEGLLCVEHRAQAKSLYAPLVLAIRREHLDAPITWRPLTIVENLQLQPPDVAVGYRLQLDRLQWIFYRSLAQARPRTLLGCHTAADFCACTFDYRTGNAESLLEVSGADDEETEETENI